MATATKRKPKQVKDESKPKDQTQRAGMTERACGCDRSGKEPAPDGAECIECGGIITAQENPKTQEPPKAEHVLHEQPDRSSHAQKIKESRGILKHPVPAGQQLFEAPDGFVMLGEVDQHAVWYREGNGGKGMWIKPYRG